MDDTRWSVWAATGLTLSVTGLGAIIAWWTVAAVMAHVSAWWLVAPVTVLLLPGTTIFASAMFGRPIRRLAKHDRRDEWRTIGERTRGER